MVTEIKKYIVEDFDVNSRSYTVYEFDSKEKAEEFEKQQDKEANKKRLIAVLQELKDNNNSCINCPLDCDEEENYCEIDYFVNMLRMENDRS